MNFTIYKRKDLTPTEKQVIVILLRGFKQIITALEKLFKDKE